MKSEKSRLKLDKMQLLVSMVSLTNFFDATWQAYILKYYIHQSGIC